MVWLSINIISLSNFKYNLIMINVVLFIRTIIVLISTLLPAFIPFKKTKHVQTRVSSTFFYPLKKHTYFPFKKSKRENTPKQWRSRNLIPLQCQIQHPIVFSSPSSPCNPSHLFDYNKFHQNQPDRFTGRFIWYFRFNYAGELFRGLNDAVSYIWLRGQGYRHGRRERTTREERDGGERSPPRSSPALGCTVTTSSPSTAITTRSWKLFVTKLVGLLKKMAPLTER